MALLRPLEPARLIGMTTGTAQFSWLKGARVQYPETFREICLLDYLHYVPKNVALTAEQQSKVKDYFDFRITEAVSTLVAAESATAN
jgi:hypothetical protein